MNPEVQTAVVLALVVCAFGFFALRWRKGRRKPGCGGGCGCSPRKL
ncbi:MAG: FeoB-associated Cys-rich membrane protein [Chthoniobacterales bacterium]